LFSNRPPFVINEGFEQSVGNRDANIFTLKTLSWTSNPTNPSILRINRFKSGRSICKVVRQNDGGGRLSWSKEEQQKSWQEKHAKKLELI
jgi:hypothetical protein